MVSFLDHEGFHAAAGDFVGPNVYAYVSENPWSKFDAHGLCWAYAVDAGFAIWDTGSYWTGHIDKAEYSKRMAITTMSVALNTASGGGFTGGGLVARALVRGGQTIARAEHVVKPVLSVGERVLVSTSIQTANHFNEIGQAGNNVVNAMSSDRSGGKPPESSASKNAANNEFLVGKHGEMPSPRA